MNAYRQHHKKMRYFGLMFASVVVVVFAGEVVHIFAQNEKLQADLQKTQEAMMSMEAELKDLQATRAEKESVSYSSVLQKVGWSAGSMAAPSALKWAMQTTAPAVEPTEKYGCITIVNQFRFV
mmetsp:Transcript_34580/g.51832  ORF Transcript_34580/g.51832 Transcript_34580/m.51832 type:complete len:123 (+) Transcript_34580:281-649(+)